MSADEVMFDLLKDASCMFDAVGDRIYNDFAPRGATEGLHDKGRAYVTFFNVVSPGHAEQLNALGIEEARYQVDGRAATTKERATIAEAIRNRIDGLTQIQRAGRTVQSCILDEKGAFTTEAPEAGQEKPIFRVRMEARLWLTQAVPTHT